MVLDSALENFGSLINKKFLDPACGSGIFLVGLFNRIAEEWKQANPNSRNDRRARELMRLLQQSLFGIDINRTACRITAFSLYLAYLDQLAPRDIQELQKKGRALPHLIAHSNDENGFIRGNIQCCDFFSEMDFNTKIKGNFDEIDLVIGNPPWGSIAKEGTPADKWCKNHSKPLPDNQIASAFVWKAAEHVGRNGKICFVLPHGILVNHGTTAKTFQKTWLNEHTLDRVLNLADLRKFLFNEARHPAVVVNFQNKKPDNFNHKIKYWSPKASWLATQVEMISVSPLDRIEIPLNELIGDLNRLDGPQLWTQRFWGTRRDLRFIERLSLYPRLRDVVRKPSEKNDEKPWIGAEGYQSISASYPVEKTKLLETPSRNHIDVTSKSLNLFLLKSDCEKLTSNLLRVRGTSNTNTDVYKAPHVLITKGFKRIAFADFDVTFRRAVGIHGPKKDRNLLIFLAAYLRTPLAKYFAFHTSHNWSMFHEEVQVNELMRLPFPFPGDILDSKKSWQIVDEVASIVDEASKRSEENFLTRSGETSDASALIEPLISEYFGVQDLEKILIEDTLNVIIGSIQPSPSRMPVPTVKYSSLDQQEAYKSRICGMLNMWGKNSTDAVRGVTDRSDSLGIGIVILEKVLKSEFKKPMEEPEKDILKSLDLLRNAIPQSMKSIDPIRGLMVFHENRLYVVKPLAQRYWTQTSAMNDADEVAGTILMHNREDFG